MKKKPAKMKAPGGLFERIRRFAVIAAVLIIIAIPVSAFSYLYFSKRVFPLESVSFYGNKNLSVAELTNILSVRKGQNLFRLSNGGLAGKLLKSPWIRRAAVRKSYSEGRLLVEVEEREPFVLLRQSGTLWIADIQGRPLEALQSGAIGNSPGQFLPVIEADLDGHYDTFREAIIFARLLKSRGYFQSPLVINAAGGTETLSMKIGSDKKDAGIDAQGGDGEGGGGGGILVRVGFGDYEQKLLKLEELKSEIDRRGIRASAIDLRFANRVVVTPIAEVSK